jgi:hypothetical protein
MFRYLCAVIAVLLIFTLLGVGQAWATRPSVSAYAAPGSFACQATTAANRITPPPPLWQSTGRMPSAADLALANAVQRPCAVGQVAVPITTGHGVRDLLPIGPSLGSEGPALNGSGLGLLAEGSGTQPPQSGVGCKNSGCYWYAKSEATKKRLVWNTRRASPNRSSRPFLARTRSIS